jgi:hypothetical protein
MLTSNPLKLKVDKSAPVVFNTKQQILSDKLLELIEKRATGMVLIEGSGGTGKSYTVLQTLQMSGLGVGEAVITTPTDSLKEHWESQEPPYEVKTIFSLLKFFPKPNDDGRQFLQSTNGYNRKTKTWEQQADIPYYVVIIDEIFSVPNLLACCAWQTAQVLWIVLGDEGQLKAIGDTTCELKDYTFLYRTVLTEQMRQKEGSALHKVIEEISKLGAIYKPEFSRPAVFQNKFYELAEAGKSCSFVAYHNHRVNQEVRTLRQCLFDAIDDQPVPGEFIRLKKLTDEKGKKIIHSNAIVKVVSVLSDCFMVEYKSEIITCPFLEFHPDGTSLVDKQYYIAMKKRDKKEWVKFYNLQSYYARIGSPYGSTAHSLQGQTVDYIFLGWYDLLKCRTDPNILYSAASRAKEGLYFSAT